ncbi:MAG: pyridoxamine 5'-phosphate oxidase family protein [Acidimicrobiia bacterium]
MTVLDEATVLADLDEAECYRLLGAQAIGRIGMIADGRVCVLPVNYVLLGHTIVLRTAIDSWFDRAVRSAALAFEVDHADPAYHTGWSVLAHGTAIALESRLPIAALDTLPLRPWGLTVPPAWVGIDIEEISGRRIVQVMS